MFLLPSVKIGATMSDDQKNQELTIQSEGRLTRGQAWGRVQSAPTRDLSVFAYEPNDLQGAVALSQILCRTTLVPEFLRGKPDETLMVLMDGRERGLTAMQSLRLIHPFESQGKAVVAYSADLLSGLVFRSGLCEDWVIVEMSDQKAAIKTKRKGASEATLIEYTIDDAKRANLLGKANWQKDPKAMLLARCKTRTARAVYPDVTANMYTEDELGVMAEAAQPPVERKVDSIVKNVTARQGGKEEVARDDRGAPVPVRRIVGPVNGATLVGAEETIEFANPVPPQPWGDDSADPVIESEIKLAPLEGPGVVGDEQVSQSEGRIVRAHVPQLIKLAKLATLGGGKEDDEAALRSLVVREFKCRLESLTDEQVAKLTAKISEG
jgi:hypothetical protein